MWKYCHIWTQGVMLYALKGVCYFWKHPPSVLNEHDSVWHAFPVYFSKYKAITPNTLCSGSDRTCKLPHAIFTFFPGEKSWRDFLETLSHSLQISSWILDQFYNIDLPLHLLTTLFLCQVVGTTLSLLIWWGVYPFDSISLWDGFLNFTVV